MVKLCACCFEKVAHVGCRCASCGGAAPVAIASRRQRAHERARIEERGEDMTDLLIEVFGER